MKFIQTINLRALTVLLCLSLVIYSSCKKDPVEPTEIEIKTALLKGSAWIMQGVKVDDVVLDLYKDMNISFTEDGKYTSVKGGVIWPASGTWKFKDEEAKIIVREDNLEIGLDALTEKSMTISFTRTGDTVFEPGGRSAAVGGKHVITMRR